MFKQIFRKIAPNPLDRLLKKAAKNNQKKFLLAWNRGLGDIPLGLYAIIYRIREFIPDCSITFLTRPKMGVCFSSGLGEGTFCFKIPISGFPHKEMRWIGKGCLNNRSLHPHRNRA